MWGERGGMGEEKVWRGLGHLWQLKVPRIHKLGKLPNVGEHLDRITVGSATPHKPLSPACNTSSHHPPTVAHDESLQFKIVQYPRSFLSAQGMPG